MSLKRKYTVILNSEEGKQTVYQQEAECMKTLDRAIVLMDWDEAGCTYKEVAFFRFEDTDKVSITSENV